MIWGENYNNDFQKLEIQFWSVLEFGGCLVQAPHLALKDIELNKKKDKYA